MTTEKLDRQDAFNLIYTYYKNGGRPGFEDGQCKYLTTDRGMCSGGVLLKHFGVSDDSLDEVSNFGDNSPALTTMIRNCHLENKLTEDCFEFLKIFQYIHDQAVKTGKDVLVAYQELAKMYNFALPLQEETMEESKPIFGIRISSITGEFSSYIHSVYYGSREQAKKAQEELQSYREGFDVYIPSAYQVEEFLLELESEERETENF